MNKKKTHKKMLIWLKDAWLKAIVVFLIVAGGFYAYAQITWPDDEPNPTTGVVGMFVGESSAAYTTGSDYDSINDLCSGTITDPDGKSWTGCHVCTQDEMMNSYNHGKAGIAPIFTYDSSNTLWINSGPPGFTANANDCKGWTATTSPISNPNYGRVWNFPSQYGGLLPCSTANKKFACCK